MGNVVLGRPDGLPKQFSKLRTAERFKACAGYFRTVGLWKRRDELLELVSPFAPGRLDDRPGAGRRDPDTSLARRLDRVGLCAFADHATASSDENWGNILHCQYSCPVLALSLYTVMPTPR